MSTAEFIYKGGKTDIQCQEEDKIEDIIQKFCTKIGKRIEEMYYLYGGSIIDKNLKFINLINSEDKLRNKISILVNDDESMDESNEQYLKKSKYIICPQCKENIHIKINNYKIELYACQNSHNIKNLSFDDFEKSQFIDESKIVCDFCKSANKTTTYENLFYICFTCNKKICPLCKSSHDKAHSIIDYDEKFFKCSTHYESYTFYCEQCKKNICVICHKEHSNHKVISHGDIMPDKKELESGKNELRKKLDEFENEIQKIINKLNNVIQNFEMYYNIYNDMINGYEIQKRNYQILQNLNYINEYNKNFIKDLDVIIKEQNIKYKFEKIMNIWDKINLKEKDLVVKNKENINDIEESKQNKEEINLIKDVNKGKEQTDTNDSIFFGIGKDALQQIKNFVFPDKKIKKKNENFDIEKIQELITFETKIRYNRIIPLLDQRILLFNKNEGEFSVYRYNNNKFESDIYNKNVKSLTDMIQLKDGKIMLGQFCNKLKIVKFEQKEFKYINQIKVDIAYPEFYILSDGKIIIYGHSDKNVFIYSYSENNLINKETINTDKFGVSDICEINNKQIAISCWQDQFFGFGCNYFILFYDFDKKEIIKIIKNINCGGKLCYMNQKFLISVSDKIYLVDLIKHKVKTKINCKNNEHNNYQVLKINENGFIVIRDNIYYYEIKNDNKIEFKGQNLFGVNCGAKLGENKLIIGKQKEICIYDI